MYKHSTFMDVFYPWFWLISTRFLTTNIKLFIGVTLFGIFFSFLSCVSNNPEEYLFGFNQRLIQVVDNSESTDLLAADLQTFWDAEKEDLDAVIKLFHRKVEALSWKEVPSFKNQLRTYRVQLFDKNMAIKIKLEQCKNHPSCNEVLVQIWNTMIRLP